MKLIIEVTETIYEMCKEWQEVNVSTWSENIIANGIPYEKKGKWITKPRVHGVTYCSECDFELKIDDTNFCPNCGANMRGDV